MSLKRSVGDYIDGFFISILVYSFSVYSLFTSSFSLFFSNGKQQYWKEEGDGMGSLNLEDFALVDITGLAVQIGNFKILLSDYYFFLLNYVHYQLRWILVLADAGYSKPQIKAVTGHKSDKAKKKVSSSAGPVVDSGSIIRRR
jgi:hypothetical protein